LIGVIREDPGAFLERLSEGDCTLEFVKKNPDKSQVDKLYNVLSKHSGAITPALIDFIANCQEQSVALDWINKFYRLPKKTALQYMEMV
jgi:hypothetical protein